MKTFNYLKVGESLYIIVNTEEDLTLNEVTIDEIKVDKANRMVYCNNELIPFKVKMSSLDKAHLTLTVDDVDYALFMDKDAAMDCFNALAKEMQDEEHTDLTDDKKHIGFNLKYSSDDIDAMDEEELKDAIKDMSPKELMYHLFTSIKDVVNTVVDAVNGKDDEEEEEDSAKPSDEEDESDDEAKCYSGKLRIVDETYPCKNAKPINFNDTTARDLKTKYADAKAILGITINDGGCLSLDETHYAKKGNPLYFAPKHYFYKVVVPAFTADTPEKDVDAIYAEIEKWIYNEYPELESLEYGTDWTYAIYDSTDLTIFMAEDTKDFNSYR